MDEFILVKNETAHRYELRVAGRLAAFVEYLRHGPVIELPHTLTEPEFRGRGLAGQVVDFALADIAAAGQQVRPTCPYVAQRIAGNPKLEQLLER
ncbi:MAG: GNAT family N-acetyltransferase [Propionibacteriaceae bacterium]|nr:GNAT family N-acetyltransferase [Propionibacteriaceae bacterium]